MTTMTVVKDDRGRLVGFTKKDETAYRRFKKVLEELGQGEIFTLDYWFPREGWRHRKHFKMLAMIFDAQEVFADPEQLRMWLHVGAGHCDFLPGPKGELIAVPKSIAYNRIDDVEFADHHEKVKVFLRTEHAQRFLWPHLDPANSSETIEAILYDFENEQPR
jgi:hypothetical protein